MAQDSEETGHVLSRWKRFSTPLRIVAGLLLILFGIVGLVLPFLQGILMISGGIVLLMPNTRFARWARRQARRLRSRLRSHKGK